MRTILAPLFEKVNSATCCATNSAAYSSGMEKTSKKSKIEPVHIEEAARLKRLFDARSTTSQMKFGADNEIGSQGMVWQYLNARAPLNLDAALKFAKGLGCPVSDFSPRLAESLRPTQAQSFGYKAQSQGFVKHQAGSVNLVDPSNVEPAMDLKPMRAVPVVGEVKGGEDGYLEELEYPVGHGDGTIEWPTSDQHSYALRVRGDSMFPRYRAGEFVVVEPSIEAPLGEDVVVCLNDGRKMLKVLNWIRDGEVQLLSINNGFAPLTIVDREIRSIHYAAGRAPRSAIKKSMP